MSAGRQKYVVFCVFSCRVVDTGALNASPVVLGFRL